MPHQRIKSIEELRVNAIQKDSKYAWEQYRKAVLARSVKKDKSNVDEWLREFHNANRVYQERSRVQSSEVH